MSGDTGLSLLLILQSLSLTDWQLEARPSVPRQPRSDDDHRVDDVDAREGVSYERNVSGSDS